MKRLSKVVTCLSMLMLGSVAAEAADRGSQSLPGEREGSNCKSLQTCQRELEEAERLADELVRLVETAGGTLDRLYRRCGLAQPAPAGRDPLKEPEDG